jgi:hypothetical protein
LTRNGRDALAAALQAAHEREAETAAGADDESVSHVATLPSSCGCRKRWRGPSPRAMKMAMRWTWALCLCALSCASLPEYAAPKEAQIEGDDPLAGDLIEYRKLARGDFKGTEAPEAFRGVADKVGAATCARIVSQPPAEIEITEKTSSSGEKTTTGRIKTIGYRALMDRGCSWWNETLSAQDPVYVLQHEQIHFALFEVEARRLDRSVKAMAKTLLVEGDSLDDVRVQVERRIQDAFDDTTETLLERNRDFDEDTSLGYEPEQQQRWYDTVMRELKEG